MSAADDSLIGEILRASTIAVVGLSSDPAKPSHDVARYLQSHGYRIVPVNPTIDGVLGERSYKSLLDLPEEFKRQIDVVDVFRRAEDVPPIVAQVVQLHRSYGHSSAIWMQLGIVNEDAAEKAKAAGLNVIMDRCMKIEHMRLRGH
jgi:hypothetical protein